MRKTPIFVLAGFMAVFEALIVALAPHRIFADEAAMPVKERYRNVDRRQRPHVPHLNVELGLDAGARRRTMTCRGPICRNISGSRSGSLGDGRIASERLKNVGEDRRSTLEDCVRTRCTSQVVRNISSAARGLCIGRRHIKTSPPNKQVTRATIDASDTRAVMRSRI